MYITLVAFFNSASLGKWSKVGQCFWRHDVVKVAQCPLCNVVLCWCYSDNVTYMCGVATAMHVWVTCTVRYVVGCCSMQIIWIALVANVMNEVGCAVVFVIGYVITVDADVTRFWSHSTISYFLQHRLRMDSDRSGKSVWNRFNSQDVFKLYCC